MATATVSISTLSATFGTHCTISPNPKSQFSQPFNFNRVPSHSSNLTFSPRFPLSPLPKSTESAVAQTETGSLDPEPAQIVSAQPPSWEPGLFAVVMVGSRQYIVHPGRWIVVQRLKGANVNDKIALHKVLLVGTDTSCYIGKPIVTNAVVYATVEEQGLDPKVIVFKYKKKKHYRRTIGHRQPNTRLRINSIMGYENYPKVTMDDLKSEDPQTEHSQSEDSQS